MDGQNAGYMKIRSYCVLVDVQSVSKQFPIEKGSFSATSRYVHAVSRVNLSIQAGLSLALVGESGSGKTTLGRIIAGLLEPTEGSIIFNDHNLTKMSPQKRREVRNQLQIVFQDPYSSLNPRHNIRTILARPYEIHTKLSSQEINEKIKELLDIVGLTPPEMFMYRYPHQFSGGQRQRVSLARAIALRPKFIIADEPVSSLDMSIKAQLLTLLKQFQEDLNLTYLFITHELSVTRTIAKYIAVMYLGKIVEYGPISDFFNGPLHPYSEALLSATPILNPEIARNRQRIILHGPLPSPVQLPTGCYFHTRCPYSNEICSQKEPTFRTLGQRQVACHFIGDNKFPLSGNLSKDLLDRAQTEAEDYKEN
jgi:oligopeptide/dipeptide ABC transporter ATP-binding protein